MNLYRGLAVIISGTRWITDFTSGFKMIGSTAGGFLCPPVLIYAAAIALFAFMLRKMNFGRKLYALGGNPTSASLMGLNVNSLRVRVYVINGMLLALAGLLFASMMNSIQAATASTALQFQTMSAVLIGGANIFGGAGSILGTVAGSFLMGSIKNGLVQIRASEYWLDFFTGAIILLALIANLLQNRKWRRK
jgi:ribose transport system permease protein